MHWMVIIIFDFLLQLLFLFSFMLAKTHAWLTTHLGNWQLLYRWINLHSNNTTTRKIYVTKQTDHYIITVKEKSTTMDKKKKE